MSSHQYPEDEFDQAGKDSPVGVHRQKPSQWKMVLPFILVLIIVPILAWLGVSLIAGNSNNSDNAGTTETTVTSATEPSEEATEPTTEAEEPTEQETETEASESEGTPGAPSTESAIEVLNGTGVNGLAAGVVGTLQGEGYQYVSAANASGWVTEATTIYYAPGNLEGAQYLGQLVGINNFVENADVLGNSDFIIILKGDYQ